MPKLTNKRDLILETALKLFAEYGYSATPISLIAKRAKISQGLMYNFFKSKNELLKEMMLLGAGDIHESMKSYKLIGDPKIAIRLHIEQTVKIIQEKKEFWRLLHAIRLQGGVLKDVEDLFREIVSTVTKVFEKIFKSLGYENPRLEAQLFLTQIDGLVILYLQDPSLPIKKLSEQLVKRYTK